MKLLDWHWEDFGIPCILKLKKTVYEAAEQCWKDKCNWHSGGFSIGWEDDFLYVEFSIEAITVGTEDIDLFRD